MMRERIQHSDAPSPASGAWSPNWREDAVAPIGLEGLHGGCGVMLEDAVEALSSGAEESRATPQPTMRIADFVRDVFVPELVALKNLSGRTHYQAILKHALTPAAVDWAFGLSAATSRTRLKAVPGWPYLDHVRLCDARPDDVQKLLTAASARGYSSQTVVHIRSVVGAIFALAKKKRCFTGDNPASDLRLPEMIRKETHALTLAQAEEVLGVMQHPEREVALIMILTGMNVAEICGLQWQYVNLTGTWSEADGESIPPGCIAVRKQWCLGHLDKLGKQGRNRILPIPEQLSTVLARLRQRARFSGPEDFVLVTPDGRPVGAKQIAASRLKAIGRTVQMPWLSWHVFGRTHTALAYQYGMQFLQRVVLMRRAEPFAHSARLSPGTAASGLSAESRANDLALQVEPSYAVSR
jgi:integrase